MEHDDVADENQKTQIIATFMNREKVQCYFDFIKTHNLLTEIEYDFIQGISEAVKEDLASLFALYGIEAKFFWEASEINHETWKYICKPLTERDLDYYLPLFFREFSLYPVTLLRKSGLKSVYFVNSLNLSTEKFSQYRAAVPDYSLDTMAMVYCCKERNVCYISNVIHHEFFHFIDYVEDATIYGPDPEWECYNLPEFSYGYGGAYNRVWKPLNDEIKGFLNYYSTTGIEEDKAEIFAHMMNYPKKAFENDCTIIQGKISFIKDLLKRFDPNGMGQADFWERLIVFRDNS